ncbi:hypothetical protein [Pseudoduganella umbonata]|uniref:Uncharacterized protein n=1 Tax=Pseudoduganella umbonata TaxID=864828 RepID=A0A4P8HNB9_9BURK|nr:hypothetical protein [Pseudoduganella umbonata]MBB3221375.1 hypothetical protein [Pseudoduganella umbonata]QCP10536.1 hypothetical protein FCL38_08905 [Pseudoduganella umbonata]
MAKPIVSLILGIAAAGAFSTAAAADIAAGTGSQAPAEAKQAAPAPNGSAQPGEEPVFEPSTMTEPEEPNGTTVKG